MNKIKDVDFLTTFPPALKQDEKMVALGRLVANELHITAEETKKNIIYANINELPETWLDTLAYDLHVDWYDYDYPVEAKRAIIYNSIRVHQKLGTKYAVETVLKDIYRTAEIEEWFEYGGEPYLFKIKIDINNEELEGGTSREIENNVQFYKNLRSHCDEIIYKLEIEKAKHFIAGATTCNLMVEAANYTEQIVFNDHVLNLYIPDNYIDVQDDMVLNLSTPDSYTDVKLELGDDVGAVPIEN